jgi:hypothetical protein
LPEVQFLSPHLKHKRDYKLIAYYAEPHLLPSPCRKSILGTTGPLRGPHAKRATSAMPSGPLSSLTTTLATPWNVRLLGSMFSCMTGRTCTRGASCLRGERAVHAMRLSYGHMGHAFGHTGSRFFVSTFWVSLCFKLQIKVHLGTAVHCVCPGVY